MHDVGPRVRALRQARGWTRRELARRCGLHEVHLAKVETGARTRLEGKTMVALAHALGVSTDYLFGLTDDPRPRRWCTPRQAPQPA
jgi:transcriptional regulator with XRE-family HTH domain